MAAELFFLPFPTAFTSNGLPAPGAQAFFYYTGTTTPADVYTTAGMTTVHPNPVVADSSGYLPPIYLDDAVLYKLIIRDRNGIQLGATIDPYQAGTQVFTSIIVGEASGNMLAFTPEAYGALGDGSTNDTSAFQALGAAVEAASGGCIWLRMGATYLVGRQTLLNNGTYMWFGEEILLLDGLTRPLTIYGNGARMKLAPGLKFGTFNAAGAPTTHTLPYSGGDRSSLNSMIVIQNCTGHIAILGGLELDGNGAAQTISSTGFGDTGYQIEADGLLLFNNSGGGDVRGVYSHHHLRDGAMAYGPATAPITANAHMRINMRSLYNGRQGFSLIGGRSFRFYGCQFNFTGKGALYSAPGAGVDIEAEVGIIRDIVFDQCQFVGNTGANMVADSGDSADCTFNKCLFGGTNYATFFHKKGFVFNDCTLVGGNILPNLGSEPTWKDWEFPHFTRCLFSDDVTLLPAGETLGGVRLLGAGGGDLGGTCFSNCHFRAGYAMGSAESAGGHFTNCSFDLGGALAGALLSPSLYGRTKLELANSSVDAFGNTSGVIQGRIIDGAGTDWRKGSKTFDPGSLADGARETTTVSVQWVRTGRDVPVVTFSNSLQGINVSASYVSAEGSAYVGFPGTVTVVFENRTGGVIDLASGTLSVAVVDKDFLG